MAESTPNLKLTVEDDTTSTARANLFKIDAVGGTTRTLNNGTVVLRSADDIQIEPESTTLGGSGTGGTVEIGTSNHDITTKLYGTLQMDGTFRLEDTGAPGTNYLTMQYTAGGLDATLTWTLTGNSTVTVPTGTITLADLTSTQTLDSKTLTNTTIDSSLNTISNIVDADISASAAISGTKVSPDFGTQNVTTGGELRLDDGGSDYVGFKADPSLSASQIWTLPTADGSASQVLRTDGAGNLDWTTVATSALGEYNVRVGSALNVATDTDTNAVGDILADSLAGLTIKGGIIDNANINASAGIETSKLEALTASVVPQLDGSGFLEASSVTNTELGHLSGVTSALQTQIDSKLTAASNLSDVADASTSRDNLGLTIGTNVQAYDAQLDDIAGLTPTNQHVIIGDGANWGQTALTSASGLQQTTATWLNADGVTKAVAHNFGNQRVQVQIFDENDELIGVDTVDQTDANTVTLTSSQAPATSWTVLIKEIV